MSTPGFLELQLDPKCSYGTKGGLTFNTLLVTNPSRVETRIIQQSRGYWALTINLNDKSRAQMKTIRSHFEAVRGKAYGWRFRNWQDYQATYDLLVKIDGFHYQLSKTRTVAGVTTVQPIRKPEMGVGIALYKDDVLLSTGVYSLDTTTGVVTFGSDQGASRFNWTGTYDMPARFDVDTMEASWDDFDVMSWDSIPVLEIPV